MTGNDNYSHGISDCVLYYDKTKPGVPWEGLISFGEKFQETKKTPVYYFGEKIAELMNAHDFSGTLTCYTYPEELEPFMGYYEDPKTGLTFDEQEPKTGFSISYKTQIGDSGHYKLHFLWNLSLDTAQYDYQTDSNTVNATTFPIDVTGVPLKVYGKKAVHMILDSRKTDPGVMNQISKSAKTKSLVELLSYFDYTQEAPYYGLRKVGELPRGHNLLPSTPFINFEPPAKPGARVVVKTQLEHNVDDAMAFPSLIIFKTKDIATGKYNDPKSIPLQTLMNSAGLNSTAAIGGGLYRYITNGTRYENSFVVPEGVVVEGYAHVSWNSNPNVYLVKSEAYVNYFADSDEYTTVDKSPDELDIVYGTTKDATGTGSNPKQNQVINIAPKNGHVVTSFAQLNANRTSTQDPYVWIHTFENGVLTTDTAYLNNLISYLNELGFTAKLSPVNGVDSVIVMLIGMKGFVRIPTITVKPGAVMSFIWGVWGTDAIGVQNYDYANAISYPDPNVSF